MNKINNPLLSSIISEMKVNNLVSYRGICPSCGSKDSFTMSYNTLDNKYIYNCYKLSCGLKGIHKDTGNMNIINSHRGSLKRDTTPSSTYRLPTYIKLGLVAVEASVWLTEHNAIDAYNMGLYTIYTDLREDRIVVPLLDTEKRVVNYMGRTWSTHRKPKVRIYNRGQPCPPFLVGSGTTLVLVEDFASACNVGASRGYIGMAILGTQFNLPYHLPYIPPTIERILVALDKDATTKGVSIVSALQTVHNNVQLLLLDKDIKDIPNNILTTEILP